MRCLWNGVHPCGKCPACLANRQRGFMFRLDQEKEYATWYYWLTLQYDEDHVPRLPSGEYCFSKEHCRLFFEHIRIKYRDEGITFKHFLVSEYGPNATHRPHYHCLLLVYAPGDFDINKKYKVYKDMRKYLIDQAWKYGHVTEKQYHGRVLRYLTKYCCKPEIIGEYHEMPPFTMISKGIGERYLEVLGPRRLEQMRQRMDFTVLYGSGRMQLPRYYMDKFMPHTRVSLDKALDQGDMDLVNTIQDNYYRLRKYHNKIGSDHQKKIDRVFKGDTYGYVRKVKSDRSLAFDEFKTKVQQRKNL